MITNSDWGNLVEYSDEDLLKRAVKNARSFHASGSSKHPRWVGVMSAFALGSTYSKMLCRRFDFDPDEEVSKRNLG